MSGYIKDHRKELDSDIWLMPPLYHRTWQWLKYNVNHADNEIPMRDGNRMLIKRGQRLTSVRDIAKGISWYEGKKYKEPNPKSISAILDWMIKTNMILITRGQGNREYTLITLINYELYNEKDSQGNSKVTAEKHLADINNNEKNYKELKTSTTTTTDENPYRIYESERFGFLSSIIGERIGAMIDQYTERWVCEAMKEAVYYEIKTLPYVKGILADWEKTGHPEPWTLPKKEKPAQRTNVKQFKHNSQSGKSNIPIIKPDITDSRPSEEELERMRQRASRLDEKAGNKKGAG